jgi:hypothetical protein
VITTKTGAFYPAIPPYHAAQKLHGLLIDEDSLSTIDPQTCNIPQGSSVDFVKMLNLLWQVKSFDVTTEWDFNTPPEIENSTVTYYPSKSGQGTQENVTLIDPKLGTDPENPTGPQIPTNPWRDIALGLVVGNIAFVETPYPADRDEARTRLRETYGGLYAEPFRIVTIKSELPYPQERDNLVDDFNFYFQDWTERTQAILDKLQGNTTAGGLKWIAEMQRHLEVIPEIKTEFENQYLTPLITAMDATFASQGNADPGFQLATNAKNQSFFYRNAITRQEDIELFELYRGFEQGLEFLGWHYQRRFGVECFASQRGFNSESGVFPCGFYFETVAAEYLSAILLTEKQEFRWMLESTTEYEYPTKFGETISTANTTATKTLEFQSSLIGTDATRVRKEALNMFGGGSVSGGAFSELENPPPSEPLWVTAGFTNLYNAQTGQPQEVDDPESYGAEADEYVYAGPYFSGRNWNGARDFFANISSALISARETEPAQIGTFRFKSADDDVIYETPIYGNPFIWTQHDITFKVKSLWNDPAP